MGSGPLLIRNPIFCDFQGAQAPVTPMDPRIIDRHDMTEYREYAYTVCNPHRQKLISELEKVQRRVGRYACNNFTNRTPINHHGKIT